MKLTWTLQIFINWQAATAGNYEKFSQILQGNYKNHKNFYISKYHPYGAATAPSDLIDEGRSHMRSLLYKCKNISTVLFLETIRIPSYC